MIGSPGAKAAPSVSFGVQGYVEELPAGFSSAVVLIGRPGIAATQMAWGEAVRRNAGSRRQVPFASSPLKNTNPHFEVRRTRHALTGWVFALFVAWPAFPLRPCRLAVLWCAMAQTDAR